jgi:hypothetical protein
MRQCEGCVGSAAGLSSMPTGFLATSSHSRAEIRDKGRGGMGLRGEGLCRFRATNSGQDCHYCLGCHRRAMDSRQVADSTNVVSVFGLEVRLPQTFLCRLLG